MKTVKLNTRVLDSVYEVVSDEVYAQHIGDQFEPETCELINCLASGKAVAMDVGANIGMTSLLLSQASGEVHAFEPAQTTFGMLEENIRLNGIRNVTTYNCGLGDVEKASEITFAPGNASGGFVSDQTSASEGHIVEPIQIKLGDSFQLSPEFIKLDVEGYEQLALRGLKQTINSSRPIVMFEVNHWCLNAFQRTSLPDFIDFVVDMFDTLYAVEGLTYLDVCDPSERYLVTYHNILSGKYQNFVGAFEQSDLSLFKARFSHRESD